MPWFAARLKSDVDVDTCGEGKLLQFVHSVGCGFDDVDEALVSTNLELVHRLLVDVDRTVDGELFDPRGNGDRTQAHISNPAQDMTYITTAQI